MAVPDGYCKSGAVMGSSPTSILSPTSESYSSTPPVSPDGELVLMMRRMKLCGGFGSGLPSAPKFEEESNDGFDGIDVGWVSELVK